MSRSGRACSGLAALVLPDHLAVAAGAREHAGEHEQQVGQAVEVADRLRPHRLLARQGDGFALGAPHHGAREVAARSEEHTSELQSLMRSSYAGFCLKKKK